jgi:8-oxo-dGTP diphosphatase
MKRVRAIIIKDEKILFIKRTKEGLVYWVMPGGEIEAGESNEQALIRECQEELGVTVKVGELFFSGPSGKPGIEGQMEYFYFCEIINGQLGTGQGPEYQPNSGYIGSYEPQWRSLKEMMNFDIKPAELRDLLNKKYNIS